MRISFSQKSLLPRWLLALLLLMYVGQSVASVSVPCHLLSQETEMPADAMPAHHQHGDAVDLSAHAGAQSDASATALHDCCDAMSHCGSGNCSMTSLNESVLYAPLNFDSAALAAATDESPARLSSSLYRPPILS